MSDVNSAVPGSREVQVRTMAYSLWLQEGCPEGRAEAHWFQAVALVEGAVSAVPAAKAKSRPNAVTVKAAGRARKAKQS